MRATLPFYILGVLLLALASAPAVADAATKRPKANTVAITKKPTAFATSPTAAFVWKVKPATVTAQCVLDKGKWGTCKAKKSYAKLKDGAHTFQVRVRRSGTRGPWVTKKFTWRIDRVAPSGAGVTYAGGLTAASSLPVTFSGGTDGATGSGVASTRLEQATAAFASGACGGFGAFATVATASPASVALADGACVQLRAVATDRAGNFTTSAAGPVVQVERSDLVLAGSPAVALEGGAAASPTIALTAPPAAPVTVTATAATARIAGTVARTFTAANWSTPQAFPLTAVNDSWADGPVTAGVTFTASSGDGNWNGEGAAGAVTVVDDDVAGITRVVAPASPALDEGDAGADGTVDVVLTSQPRANVVVTSSSAQVTATPLAVTFTPANWSTPQAITLMATNDLVDEAASHAGTVAFVATSTDAGYAGRAVTAVATTIADNDTAGYVFTTLGSVAEEDGAPDASFNLRLATEPTRTVTVTVATSLPARLTPAVGSATLTFTPANWNVDQLVTLKAVDSPVAYANGSATVTVTGSASGDAYHALSKPKPIAISVVDDDVAGVDVQASSTGPWSLLESPYDAQTFTLRLTSQPAGLVNVFFTDDGSQLVANCNEDGDVFVQFNEANWNVPQDCIVQAWEDEIVEGQHLAVLRFNVVAGLEEDPAYAALVVADSFPIDVYDP